MVCSRTYILARRQLCPFWSPSLHLTRRPPISRGAWRRPETRARVVLAAALSPMGAGICRCNVRRYAPFIRRQPMVLLPIDHPFPRGAMFVKKPRRFYSLDRHKRRCFRLFSSASSWDLALPPGLTNRHGGNAEPRRPQPNGPHIIRLRAHPSKLSAPRRAALCWHSEPRILGKSSLPPSSLAGPFP